MENNMPAPRASEVARDYEVDGVPSSGVHEIKKSDFRAWGGWLEDSIAGAAEGLVRSATLAGLPAGTRVGQPGEVTDDGANTGAYSWDGSAWVRVGDLVDTAGLEADILTLSDGLAAEAEARLQVRLDADANVQAERETRQSEDLAVVSSAPVASRPGEADKFFIDRLDGGVPSSVVGLTNGEVVTNANGSAVRISGAGVLASRSMFAVEPGRLYHVQIAVQRHTNANDPANDTVRLAIAWYSATKGRLGSTPSTVMEDLNDFTTGSGRYLVSVIVAKNAQGGVDIVAPDGAIYLRPYVQTYGTVAKTDVEVLRVTDITGTDFLAPDVTALEGRVSSLEGIDSGDRLNTLETTVTALEGVSVAYEQLPQRTLMGPSWRGGYETSENAGWRNPEVQDLKTVQAGLFGDMPLIGWLRTHGLPIELEYLNGQYLDAQQASSQLITVHRPPVVIFGHPTYLMDNVIPRELLKDIILRSHTAGIDSPATMMFENPAHTPFSFTAKNNNIRFEGVWIIEHRQKPSSAISVQFADGCKNIYIDTLVVRNALQALRFDTCDNIEIGTLVTDADTAYSANVGATNIKIGRHIKIGSKANAITGADYISVGAPSSGLWTPTITFDTPGDLSVSYSNTAAFYERVGKQIFVHGSITFTPTYTTAAGAFRLGGLRFFAKAGSESGFIGLTSMSALTWPTISGSVATQCSLSVVPGTNYMRLFGQRSGGGTGNFSVTHIVSGTAVTLRFAGFYEATV